jgi:hypothetical protein
MPRERLFSFVAPALFAHQRTDARLTLDPIDDALEMEIEDGLPHHAVRHESGLCPDSGLSHENPTRDGIRIMVTEPWDHFSATC